MKAKKFKRGDSVIINSTGSLYRVDAVALDGDDELIYIRVPDSHGRFFLKVFMEDEIRPAVMADGRAVSILSPDEQNAIGQRLLRLTPGGSEYFKPLGTAFQVDVPACVSHIENFREMLHRSQRQLAELRRETHDVMKMLKPGLRPKRASYVNAWDEKDFDKITLVEIKHWREATRHSTGTHDKLPNESQQKNAVGYIDWMLDRITDLENAVLRASIVFRKYEKHHLSKPNGQGWEKARDNALIAEDLEGLLHRELDLKVGGTDERTQAD